MTSADEDEITVNNMADRPQDREEKSSKSRTGPSAAPVSIVEDLINSDAAFSVDRMAEVLLNGPDSERDFVLFELNQLLDHCLEDTVRVIVPVMCGHVHTWGMNVQFRVAEGLSHLVSLPMLAKTAWLVVTASFRVLEGGKRHFNSESEENSFYELWGNILVDALSEMDWNVGKSDVALQFIDSCGLQSYQPLRKVAARLLSPLGQTLPSQTASMSLLPRALRLCNDENVLVRGTAVDSLADIGEQISLKKTENEIWPILEKLLEDDDARIRAAALRTMSRVLCSQRSREGADPANSRLLKELLPPVFARWTAFGKRASAQDQRLVDDDTYLLLEVVAEVYGELAYSTSLHKDNHFRKHAMRTFVGMATCNGPLIRRNCAYNMPGVALVLQEKYSTELSIVADCLSKDADEEVRWILAKGFHETVRILVTNGRHDRLLSAFGSLTQDDEARVRQNVLEHFAESVTVLTRNGDLTAMRKLVPVLPNLDKVDEFPWRSQQMFAEEVEKSVHILPPQLLLEKILPVLYKMMLKGNRLVKISAMTSIVKCFRYIPDMYLRDEAIATYWGRALEGNFAVRLAFLAGGRVALDIFSQKLFRQLFAPRLLMCTRDPVVNVRLALALMLPTMAVSCARLPLFGVSLNILKRDGDPEVRNFMKKFHAHAGKAMQEDSRKLDEDITKLRAENKFFGEPKRVHAMKPTMMSLVKDRVSANSRHRSKESVSESSSTGGREKEREAEAAPDPGVNLQQSGRLQEAIRNSSFTFNKEERGFNSSDNLQEALDGTDRKSPRRSASLKSVLEKYGWPSATPSRDNRTRNISGNSRDNTRDLGDGKPRSPKKAMTSLDDTRGREGVFSSMEPPSTSPRGNREGSRRISMRLFKR